MQASQKVVRAEDVQEIKRSVEAWAMSLRNDLNTWADEHFGFHSLTPLAYEMGFKPRDSRWRSVASGVSIATDTEIYATLYLRTNLVSADPRTIPPRYVVRRGGKEFSIVPRAWSEEEWQQWKEKHGKVEEASRPVEPSLGPQPNDLLLKLAQIEARLALVEQKPSFDFSALLNFVMAPVVELITQVVRAELAKEEKRVETPDSAIDPLYASIRQMLQQLKPFVEGDETKRDLFFRQYGREAAELGSLLMALVQPDKGKREVMISYRNLGG